MKIETFNFLEKAQIKYFILNKMGGPNFPLHLTFLKTNNIIFEVICKDAKGIIFKSEIPISFIHYISQAKKINYNTDEIELINFGEYIIHKKSSQL